MLHQGQYLLLMAACLLVTLPLEFVFGARVYRAPKRLAISVLTVALVFSLWDIVAIQYDLWVYSTEFTSGIILPFQLPLEELVFFIVIPICAVLTYEAVGIVLEWMRGLTRRERHRA